MQLDGATWARYDAGTNEAINEAFAKGQAAAGRMINGQAYTLRLDALSQVNNATGSVEIDR